MSNIRISGSPETPDDSDQIVVLSEQSNHPPIRERPFAFPEGHRKWGRPEDGAVQVSLGPKAYRVVTEHALGDSRREVGGLLLGRVFQGERPGIFHVAVDEALPDRRGVGRSATFAFTHESWGILCDEAKARFPNYRIVGWYHSHPNYGIFYSSVDQHSHQTYFDKPWLVGLVVDPKRNQGGFFSASSHGVDQLPGFYERVEDEGWFVQWNNSERTAISSHHPSQAAIVTRDRPSSRNHSESQREERQTFSKRFSEDIPLSLAFIFFVAFVLSLFALLFSVYNYSRLEARIRVLEDKHRVQENLVPTFSTPATFSTTPSATESLPSDSRAPTLTDEPIPPSSSPPIQDGSLEAPPTPNIISPRTHIIMEGDTLETIAQSYNVTVQAILDSNQYIQDPDHLPVGQILIIPLGAGQ